MSSYIQVAEDEGEEPIELPTEDDTTLLLTTLSAQFPGTCGLKYRNPESRTMRGVRLVDGRLHPPENGWGKAIYFCVFPKGTHQRLYPAPRSDPSGTSNVVAALRSRGVGADPPPPGQDQGCRERVSRDSPWPQLPERLRSMRMTFAELLVRIPLMRHRVSTWREKGARKNESQLEISTIGSARSSA